MLSNLRLIFVHGVNDQTTNYSQELFNLVLAECRKQVKAQDPTITDEAIEELLQRIVQHEVLWADLTTDLINRYRQLALPYMKPRPFWRCLISSNPLQHINDYITLHIKQRIVQGGDPLAIQIMHYIKDKGDKATGKMNILKEFENDIQRIFARDDIGNEPRRREGDNAIIVAHSLGSVIAFDYIMGFRKEHKLAKDITIKNFITLGSPIPVFISAMGYPDSDLKLPDNIHKWSNILSPLDGIARPMKPFFRNIPITEHEVDMAGFGLIKAHTSYWRHEETAAIIATEALTALGYKGK